MIVLIDNYDSFVFNLARYLERLGQTTHVVRNDRIDAAAVAALQPAAIVLSPGPCTPAAAGCSVEVVEALSGRFPILGVCLGHQAIAAAFGGRIVRAAEPMHGRASAIMHSGRGVFAGLPSPLTVGRYHSLVVDEATLPDVLEVTARTTDEVVMAIAHREHPVVGVQFHPESILTEGGYAILAAFLHQAGLPTPESIPDLASERCTPPPPLYRPPAVPVTF
jgi:anthranilate synthase/aminodeoxychorismate synthase-like glutamine amidotransferase